MAQKVRFRTCGRYPLTRQRSPLRREYPQQQRNTESARRLANQVCESRNTTTVRRYLPVGASCRTSDVYRERVVGVQASGRTRPRRMRHGAHRRQHLTRQCRSERAKPYLVQYNSWQKRLLFQIRLRFVSSLS
jgi:hypothetical protein